MRAASFKSLYQKRPHERVQMRTVASRGAPDTALRLLGTHHHSMLASLVCDNPKSNALVRTADEYIELKNSYAYVRQRTVAGYDFHR
jgi:hypothetical protein